MEKPHEFTLGGHRFRGSYLPPDKSLACLQVLAPALSEVLGSLPNKAESKDEIAAFAKVAKGVLMRFEALPQAAKYFLPLYEVEVQHGEGLVWMRVELRKDELFQGKALLFVGFLVTAIVKEYGGFLLENGLSMLQELGEACGFLKT